MSSADILAAGGILRASEVVELAAAADLDESASATVLVLESSGGANVWGRDGVSTGGIYVKGSAVTRAAYLAYRARRDELGWQGVGPCQLTHESLQDQADAAGGCWDWRTNVRVGFAHLAGLIRSYGEPDGFRRYNGSGPDAEAYRAKALPILATWRTRLRGSSPTTGGQNSGRAQLREGDTGPAVVALQRWLNAMYPAYSRIDLVPQRYGPQTVAAVKEFQRRAGVTGADADGTLVGPRTWAALTAAGYR